MQLHNRRFIFTLFLVVIMMPFTDQHVLGGGGSFDFPNPFALLQQTGLLTWENFFSDLFNLFFGKRRAICALKGINSNGGGYRDDSVMILPEAGIYVGEKSIEEYLSFVTDESPYIKEGPVVKNQQVVVEGFHDGACEFTWRGVQAYTLEESMVEDDDVHVEVLVQMTIYVDYAKNYARQSYVFFSKPFLEYIFTTLDTPSTRQFLCGTVLGGSGCASSLVGPLPNVNECLNQMGALPLASENGHVDGNSLGCRLLHGAFAWKNPRHCAHVSPDPTDLDPSGMPVCSASLNLRHRDYFDGEFMEQYREFGKVSENNDTCVLWAYASHLKDNGVDPDLGYKILSSIDD